CAFDVAIEPGEPASFERSPRLAKLLSPHSEAAFQKPRLVHGPALFITALSLCAHVAVLIVAASTMPPFNATDEETLAPNFTRVVHHQLSGPGLALALVQVVRTPMRLDGGDDDCPTDAPNCESPTPLYEQMHGGQTVRHAFFQHQAARFGWDER